jgi:hypothetical protein
MSKPRATGIVGLCDALREMVQAAPIGKRREFIQVFNRYADRYPEVWELLQSPQTPSFTYHLLGDLIETARAPMEATRPIIRGESSRVVHLALRK